MARRRRTRSERHALAHFMHDAGLAIWFGGSLMGAVGVNGAARDVDDPRQRARVANAGWGRWTPVNLVGIGMHLVGGAQLLRADKGKLATQRGLLANSSTKAVLTAAALGATGYARLLGQKMMSAGDVPVAGGVEPSSATPAEVAKAQKQLHALQWAIPALTGGILASSSLAEEQVRPGQQVQATLEGLPRTVATAARGAKGAASTAAHTAGAAASAAGTLASHKVREAVHS